MKLALHKDNDENMNDNTNDQHTIITLSLLINTSVAHDFLRYINVLTYLLT